MVSVLKTIPLETVMWGIGKVENFMEMGHTNGKMETFTLVVSAMA